jgi:hypothetical protein
MRFVGVFFFFFNWLLFSFFSDELLRKFNGVWEKDISKIFTINN